MILQRLQGASPLVIGHRGNPGNPLNLLNVENTVPSFKSANKVTANGFEFDVEKSLDQIPFIHHDDTFGRVFTSPDGDNSKLVSSYNWVDIQRAKLNIGGLESGLKEKLGSAVDLQHYNGIRIPSLDEIIAIVEKDKLLFIEIKVPGDIAPSTIEGKEYLQNLIDGTVDFIEKK